MRLPFVAALGSGIVSFLALAPCASAQSEGGTRHVQFREGHPGGYVVQVPDTATIRILSKVATPWLNAQQDNGSTNLVQLGSRVVLQLKESADLETLLEQQPLRLARKISQRLFILQAVDAWHALEAAETLAQDPRVELCYPVTRRPKQLNSPYAPKPTDPLFSNHGNGADWQANLENRDTNGVPLGPDLNVRSAWPITEGEGVTMALADDGVELDHPDLAERTAGAPHFNFLTRESNGMPSGLFSYHATAVAGLAGATANNGLGISGVAPKARIASWVIFGANDNLVDEEALMDMFQYQSNVVSVQNHSWGKVGSEQLRISSLENIAISNAVQFGRGGRGVVMVRAAGNGRGDGNDVNEDGYAADPRVIAVAAARLDGRVTRYSSPGACVLVAAPSGDESGVLDPCIADTANMVTTDRQGTRGYNRDTTTVGSGDFTYGVNGFSGTSAATPQIAGVATLILSVNTNLTYRDVQQVLINSSRHFDLSDSTLTTNAAGFRVSHNLGFGIPDAGEAVRLARTWSNRPAATQRTFSNMNVIAIPEVGFHLRVDGPDVPEILQSIQALPGAGPHPETTTGLVPLVDVGTATNSIALDLRGRAALIQRAPNYFCEKITHAAQAGATLAVVYNNRGGNTRIFMAETDLTTIPSVFISQTDGEALRDYLAAQPNARVQLVLDPALITFDVPDTIQCEFIGVRLDTDHTARGDLRIVLTSPTGTRSVLQRVNQDTVAGPRDWTYYSVQHFYESSFGRWTLSVLDESDRGQGSVLGATLLINGVPIGDTDHDGLDDSWEMQQLHSLGFGPTDDPDRDGLTNAREALFGTDPNRAEFLLELDLSVWDARLARLSWPSNTNTTYRIQIGPESIRPSTLATNLPGTAGETEWFFPYTGLLHQFFRIQSAPRSN